MDQPVSMYMNKLSHANMEVFLPMPVFPIVEDVGWWRGEDGSAIHQPYRNSFPRRHCLKDYQALVHMAEKLKVRIALGMVLGEWDRNNVLKDVIGSTWMGRNWNNLDNQGPWLEETAEYLQANRKTVELSVHGLCHEFWNRGRMERSEFHDQYRRMRPHEVVASHLDAFGNILEQNGFSEFPRLFFPPALNHSFGNGKDSIQALLHGYGISHVITRFSKARCFCLPHHQKITWECGVGLLERGRSPVPWHVSASPPTWDFSGPILPLHWGNLLHPDQEQNFDIVSRWSEMLLTGTTAPQYILAADYDTCWRQAAAFYFGRLSPAGGSIDIDLRALPNHMPDNKGPFYIKIRDDHPSRLFVRGARLLSDKFADNRTRTLQILPESRTERITLLTG